MTDARLPERCWAESNEGALLTLDLSCGKENIRVRELDPCGWTTKKGDLGVVSIPCIRRPDVLQHASSVRGVQRLRPPEKACVTRWTIPRRVTVLEMTASSQH